jgi:hypothetical protein
VRVQKYLNGTQYLKLILSVDEMNFTYTGTSMDYIRFMRIAESRLNVS